MRIYALIGILILASLLAFLQQVALAEYLYWRWWWFDILMHFLGGILVGGIGVVIANVLKTPVLPTLLVTLVVIGIGWEVFEYAFGLYDGGWDLVDTSIDLIMDTLGALLVYSGIKLWK